MDDIRKTGRSQKGFTLLEVVVVVAILAILVGLVLPNFSGIIGNARTTMVQGQLEKAREASFFFHADTGTWPDEYSDNGGDGYRQLTNGKETGGSLVTNWDGPYFERPFLSNGWGGVTRIMLDDASGRAHLNGYDFDISGTATPGSDCYLYFSKVPRKVCKTIDKKLDGTTDNYNHGTVIYHQANPSSDECSLGILIAAGGGVATSAPPPPPPIYYTLTMAVNGSGGTIPTVGDHTYLEGTVVDISATPALYWHFSHWTGNVVDPSSPSTTITMNNDEGVTANFEENLPVTVTLGASQDSYINQGAPHQNFGHLPHLKVKSWRNPAGKGKNEHSLVEFDITGIPAGASIQTATLQLYAIVVPPCCTRTYGAYRVAGSWGEASVTWNNQPAIAPSATDTASTPPTHFRWMGWEVEGDVQSFIDGTAANHGWMIKDQVEDSWPLRQTIFVSKDQHSFPQPQLAITYIPH